MAVITSWISRSTGVAYVTPLVASKGNGCGLLALHRLAKLWCYPKVLSIGSEWSGEITEKDQSQSEHQGTTSPTDFIGAMSDGCIWIGGLAGAPPEGRCDSHAFSPGLGCSKASVSREKVRPNQNSVK
jgi:hypothetical protein